MNRNRQVANLMIGGPLQKSKRAFRLEGSLRLACTSRVSCTHSNRYQVL